VVFSFNCVGTMPNRLSQETSPYLLQHAENPVDWYPWGSEALEKARQEDKPIFLSIGYAACHWCHVMAHESFEDPQIAGFLNQNFVSIKVDREERPDLDSIYMNAVVAMTGQGGWPMSVFLNAAGEPFYGGTYFPPTPRYGMPSFRQVLEGLHNAWANEREQIQDAGKKLASSLKDSVRWGSHRAPLNPETLDRAFQTLVGMYDWEKGGWGGPPKFPQPMAVEFLLRMAARGHKEAVQAAIHVLDQMSRGGMYDVVGGGFHRYSTDADWLVPHFEKMLYDNAQLALVYLHAFQLTGEDRFGQIAAETLDFIQREMTHPQGGFFSSLDADSEGEEGKFYVWSTSELSSSLFSREELDLLEAAYSIAEGGNFEGKLILRRRQTDAELSRAFNRPTPEIRAQLKQIHARLLAERSKRIRPGTDDKVLVAWNALALRAFAEAARILKREDYLQIAMRNSRFIQGNLFVNGRLMRSWREGQARQPAFLEDYAALAVALFHLYQADPRVEWFQMAARCIRDIQSEFADPAGGFFDTAGDQTDLILRPKELQDNATPSGNAMAALALLMYAAYTDDSLSVEQNELMLGSLQEALAKYPTAFGYWLAAFDFAVGPVQQIAVIGSPQQPATQALLAGIQARFLPRSILAVSDFPPDPQAPGLLADRPMKNGLPTVYVCQNFVCQLPVNTPADLETQLDRIG